jgi:uncharacterized protein (DUF1499 family)
MIKKSIFALLTLVLIGVGILALFSVFSKPPTNLGAKDGKLAPCPDTPNCVCSQDSDATHAIEPLRFEGGAEEAWDKVCEMIKTWPRTKIISTTEDYLRVECTSLVFRYIDDLECLLDREAKVIHVRSSSRVGRSDLGVNRKRVEMLRQALAQ